MLHSIYHARACARRADVMEEANSTISDSLHQHVLPKVTQLRVDLEALRALCGSANAVVSATVQQMHEHLERLPSATLVDAGTQAAVTTVHRAMQASHTYVDAGVGTVRPTKERALARRK